MKYDNLTTKNGFKYYSGRIPACGVFCGGCPVYTREKNPCPGADINFQRCEKCTTFHLCCKDRNIIHCYECAIFPCGKFRSFAKRWLKYGQDFIENQKLLKIVGEVKFLEYYNTKVNENQEENQKIMSKYELLWRYLQADGRQSLQLSFEEVKSITGFDIDHSFLTYKKEAGQFGYQVGKISLKEKHITFKKLN